MRNTQLESRHNGAIRGDTVVSINDGRRFYQRSKSVDMRNKPEHIVFLSAGCGVNQPKLPDSIRVSEYEVEQVPYIEHLGWMLVYLCQRYPELKSTPGFEPEHIRCEKKIHRTVFYGVHAFFTIDARGSEADSNHTIDIVHGDIGNGVSFWSIEIFKNGGLVRKIYCDSPDQAVTMLNVQLNNYGLVEPRSGSVTNIDSSFS